MLDSFELICGATLAVLFLLSLVHSFASFLRLAVTLALTAALCAYGMTVASHARDFHDRASARLASITP